MKLILVSKHLHTYTPVKRIIIGLTVITLALLAQARSMRTWTYQELYDQADLVVVAKPISTQNTSEKAVLPNISPDVHVVGLSTQFDISVVMKGDKNLRKCVLHHYRLANPKEMLDNGPMLASFDPKQHTRFLLFLHREADGRYAPVSGQTDPILFSVQRLEGAASVADEAARGEDVKRPEHAPYEIVLDDEHIVFDKAESVSVQITIRNLETKKLFVPDLYWGLSVVWDGKAYKRNPEYMRAWNGPADLYPFPKGLWRSMFSLSEYLVPVDLLTAGRHTIALKDASAESNTQTIFIEKASADQPARETHEKTNAEIRRPPASAADGAAWGDPVEGVSVRIRAERKRWATNETPTFKLDVRNQGHREFFTTHSQEPGRLEVDGVWYEWTGGFDLKSSSFPPGREYKDIKVTLGLDWKAPQQWRDKTQPAPSQIPLKLLPGKHTFRFAPEIREIGVEFKPRNKYVPSNPVEIEITGEFQVRVPLLTAGVLAGNSQTIIDIGVAESDVPTGLLERKGETIVAAPAGDLALPIRVIPAIRG